MSSSTSSSDGAGAAPAGALENFRAVRTLFGRDLIAGTVFAVLFFAWVLLFVGGVRGTSSGTEAMARSGALAMLGLAVGACYFRFGSLRPAFRTVALATLAFLVAGEVYFRLAFFGPDALRHPARYVPASVDYPICPIPVSSWTPTAFAPHASTLLKGARFETNAFGFRDRERTLAKPPGTIRVVVLGASEMMGAGVDQDDVFTVVLEDRLNARADGVSYEVLNLSRGAFQTIDFLHLLREWALRFDPDVILVKGDGGRRDTPRRMRREPANRREVLAGLYSFPYSASFFFQAMRDHVYFSVLGRARTAAARLRRGLSPVPPSAPVATGEPSGLFSIQPIDWRSGEKLPRQREFLALAGDRKLFATTARLSGEHDLIIYIGDRHPSAKAHRIWAEDLEAQLEPTLAELRAGMAAPGGGSR